MTTAHAQSPDALRTGSAFLRVKDKNLHINPARYWPIRAYRASKVREIVEKHIQVV